MVATVLLVVYLVVGFLVLPPIVRGQIEEKAGAALKRTVTVEKVRINPLVFSTTIDGLRVVDHDGEDLATWKRVYVNFDPLTSLLRWEWHVGEIDFIEPHKRIAIDKEGHLNIADLLEGGSEAPQVEEPESQEAEKQELPRIGLGRIFVQGWQVALSDASHRKPFATVIGPMTFELTGLTTRPNEESPYSLQGTTDTGEEFGWSGKLSVDPVGSEGEIKVSGLSLPKLAPLGDEVQRADVRNGTVSFSSKYSVELGETPSIKISDTKFEIDDLALAFAGAEDPAVQFKKLEIVLPSADAMARTAAVERVTLTGLDAKIERRADGSIDLLDWLPPPSKEPEEPATEPAGPEADTGPAPSVKIARIEIVDGRIQLTDKTNPHPAVLLLDQIEASASNTGTDMDQEVGIEAKMRWNEGGTMAVSGTVRPLPLAAAVDVQLAGVELKPLDPFVEPLADVRVREGTVNLNGHVDLAQPPEEPLSLTWTGDVSIDNLDTVDGALDSQLVAWRSIAAKATKATLDPLAVSMAEVDVVDPVVNLAIAEDGTINFMAALRMSSESSENASVDAAETNDESSATSETSEDHDAGASGMVAESTEESPTLNASVEAINISGGLVRVSDQSVRNGFKTELTDFGGSIRGLSSENVARADVDLSAKLDGSAPLHIFGAINPLAEDKYSDIKVEFSNIDLPIFSSYAGQYLGQKIQKGKLKVDLGYKVSQNTLAGENHVVFDQFYLGDKVQSPDAVKLPIGLALALLRDREGKIDLDVPVRGNLDDPDFKYGSVVWKAVGNIVLKAATSPFSMLGGMLGGGAKNTDLSYVDFASGSVEFSDEATKKLGLLAKALYERPALRLEINAPPSPESDRAGLLDKRFAQMLDTEREQWQGAASPEASAAPQVSEDQLIKALFVKRFPEEAQEFGLMGDDTTVENASNETVAESTRSEETGKKKGLLSRLFGGVLGGNKDKAEAPKPAPQESASGETAPEEAAGPPPPTTAEMREKLLATIELSDADFAELASTRVHKIRDQVLADGKVEAERVFQVDASGVPEGASPAPDGTRVYFGLE